MNYTESLNYLNSFLNLERIVYEPRNRLWNLDRMCYLLDWFDHPEKHFFSILIAGTKGKGSTGFFLESILRESGIPVGFYVSPHLEDPRERIRLHGREVSKRAWVMGIRDIRRVFGRKSLPKGIGNFTYFEIATLLAILLFRRYQVRVGIFEVGMGGRLDATNVLHAPTVILSPIALDHEAILGNRIRDIASEKAAIIHRGTDVIVSPQPKEALIPIRRRIKMVKARFWQASAVTDLPVILSGDFQRINAGAAVKMAGVLRWVHGFREINNRAIRKGLKADHWPGRMELFRGSPDFLLDGAHNPASIEALVRNLKNSYPKRNRLLIFGTSRDKKAGLMFKMLRGYFSEAIVAPTPNPRSQEIRVLLTQGSRYFRKLYPAGDIRSAFDLACKIADKDALVVATGSFYLIGELRKLIRGSCGSTSNV